MDYIKTDDGGEIRIKEEPVDGDYCNLSAISPQVLNILLQITITGIQRHRRLMTKQMSSTKRKTSKSISRKKIIRPTGLGIMTIMRMGRPIK